MSDLHLGARQSQTDKIIKFLDNNESETLILNGDIIVIMEDESVVPFHLWASDLEEVIYNAKVPVLCVTPSPAKYGSGFSNF